MIRISDELFYIHAGDFSIILGKRHGYLTLHHIGSKIDRYHFSNRLIEKDHAFSGGPFTEDRTFSLDTQRQVIGQMGRGDFRKPSIIVQHGQNQVTDFKYLHHEVIQGIVTPKGLPAPRQSNQSETLHITLFDEVAKIKLHLYYVTFPEFSTIGQFTRLENVGDEEVVIHKLLSTMMDIANDDYDLLTFQGYYGMERLPVRQTLNQGLFEIGSIRTSSGHGQSPALVLMNRDTTDDFGFAMSMQMMYSGSFEAFAQINQLGEVRLGIGINETNFQWKLQSKEIFDTPFVVMNHTLKGLNDLSCNSHRFIQEQILPENFAHQLRPILINNWEATYFDFNAAKLMSIIDEAANLGIELFVLDDGWFGKRSSDQSSLGDWVVNTEKIGGSLEKLINYAHSKELKFGLWIEPEMISENSDLYRNHPEWCIQTPNRSHTYSRSQLVLNLANLEVVEYLKKIFDELLTNYAIDYIKWDSNRNISDIGNGVSYDETMKQSHQYILGLYDLIEYLTSRHPNVLFESCSGGGGRNDLGMMSYFSQVWASDNTDAIERLAIQYGSSYLFPPITMGAHVSAVPNHQMNRITPLLTRGHVAMMGNLGYELDITKMEQSELDQIKYQVEEYKKIRETIQFGKQYRLKNPIDLDNKLSNYTATQFIYENKVVLTVVKVLSTMEKMEPVIKLKALVEDGIYQLNNDAKTRYSGAELMYAGISLNFSAGDFLSQQWVFEKIE